MYLPTDGDLGTMAKLGPCDKIFSCASVRGVLEMFLTHMLLLLLLVTSAVASIWTVSMDSMLFLYSDLLLSLCDHGCHVVCLSDHLISSYSFGTTFQILTSVTVGS